MITLEDRYIMDVFSWKELSFQVTEEKSYMNSASKIGPPKKHKEAIKGGRIFILCHWDTKEDNMYFLLNVEVQGADKALARSGRKQATATEDFDVHISYLLLQLEEY